jgi:hypothetical protein
LIHVRNPGGKKGLRRARFGRKQCGTKFGLKKKGVKVVDWIHLAQDRVL